MNTDKPAVSLHQTNLKPGEVKFYDHYKPKLPAGNYQVDVKQTIDGDGLDAPKVFERRQKFEVAGPRFRLPEGEIHSVYPPPNVEAHYEGVIPQIVFRKRTLPWERSLDSKDENDDFPIPWMALVVFEEEELPLSSAESQRATRTRAVSRPIKDMIQPGGNYLPPLLKSSLSDEENCYTIEIPKQNFKALLPKAEELSYLAHVREVNTDDKEFLGMHADGWFSVVLANRLPKTPPEVRAGSVEELKGAKFARNIVHLVSLEGFIPYLENKPHANLKNSKYTKVRLASLASWEFYCKPPEESFVKLMENLHCDMLKVEHTNKVKDPYVKTALDGGYIPLQYHTREGEKTMAWYRGPLIPVINQYEPRDKDEDVFFSVEASMIYDDKKGLFDISQAVAWQIGRLLALNDAHFSQSLLDWKKSVNRKIDELLKRKELVVQEAVDTRSLSQTRSFEQLDQEQIHALMHPNFATHLFSDNFLKRLAIAKEYFEDLYTDEDRLDLELSNFPGMLSKDEYQELLERGEDPHEGIWKAVF